MFPSRVGIVWVTLPSNVGSEKVSLRRKRISVVRRVVSVLITYVPAINAEKTSIFKKSRTNKNNYEFFY